jgi:hypothetical protein
MSSAAFLIFVSVTLTVRSATNNFASRPMLAEHRSDSVLLIQLFGFGFFSIPRAPNPGQSQSSLDAWVFVVGGKYNDALAVRALSFKSYPYPAIQFTKRTVTPRAGDRYFV